MAVGDARLTKCHYGTEGAEVNSRGVMRGLASVTHGTLAIRVCALKGAGRLDLVCWLYLPAPFQGANILRIFRG